MSQPLQTVNIMAPGFKGINTEDSPLSLEAAYATIADNCVIDKYGRLSARKGFNVISSSNALLGSNFVSTICQYTDSSGNEEIFSTGNLKILRGTTTLVDATPAGTTITGNNWKVVNFNDYVYFFQKNHDPLVYGYSGTSNAVDLLENYKVGTTLPPKGNEVLAAYGRLWVANVANDGYTVYWSDLLNGAAWEGGTSGSIDLTKVWPDGFDSIVGLAAHNNLLIIFGAHSILTYEGAEDPATMRLVDTVSGVGCVSRDSIQYTGTDVLFMSQSGLRSLGRTIQEKSLPLSDLSKNVKTDIIDVIKTETGNIRSLYSPENSFYLVYFPSGKIVYCFDLKGQLENGSYRVTRWPTEKFKCFERLYNGDVYVGTTQGIAAYSGYTDGGSSYIIRYYSPNITLGDQSKFKFLKKMRPTIIGGGSSQIIFKWGYGFSSSFKSYIVSVAANSETAYFGESEYNIAEYSGGVQYITPNINTSGQGTSFVIGLEAEIVDSISLQELNITTLIGKIG